MQPLCRSHDWTVVNHYNTQNRGLTVWFSCGNAALTVCAPHCCPNAPKLAIPCPHTYADCAREFPQRIQHSAHPMCRSTSSRCESHCPCSRSSEQNVSCWSAWWSWISVPGVGYLTPSSSLHHLFSIAGGHPAHAQWLCCALGCTVRCVHAVQKVGCLPPPVASFRGI